MVPERGLELLKLVKEVFTENSYMAHNQLIVITNSKGDQLLTSLSLNVMSKKNGVESETVMYVQQNAKDWVYVVQVKERNGEQIAHHQFALVSELMNMNIILKNELDDGWSSSLSCFYWL